MTMRYATLLLGLAIVIAWVATARAEQADIPNQEWQVICPDWKGRNLLVRIRNNKASFHTFEFSKKWYRLYDKRDGSYLEYKKYRNIKPLPSSDLFRFDTTSLYIVYYRGQECHEPQGE